ncbi:MAG: type II toxin-antitoxin system prevent-host-death family antitoxin [Chloroflexi bacterium]|nr:type II toxin-antitoxin system prevent-host-death family antitoxin [Chloroflexota bacterium]
MKQVSVHYAKAHLTRLINEALEGEEIVIAKGEQPAVRLVAVPETKGKRQLGTAKDLIAYMAEDFDAPLEDFAVCSMKLLLDTHAFLWAIVERGRFQI